VAAHKRSVLLITGGILATATIIALINSPFFGIRSTAAAPDFIFPEYGLSLVDSHGHTIRSDVLAIPPRERIMNVNVHFLNDGQHSDTFGLMAFVGDKQTAFHAPGSRSPQTLLPFFLALHKTTTIPITIALPRNTSHAHELLITVVAGPDKHAANMQTSSQSYSVSLQDRLVYPGESVHSVDVHDLRIQSRMIQDFTGLIINQNGGSKGDNATMPPPLYMDVRPGQRIRLFAHAGGLPFSSRFALIVLVGWRQQKAWGEHDDLVFRLPAGQSTVLPMQIQAPSKPGDYEVTGFFIPQSLTGRQEIYAGPVITSFRFSLKVR